MKVLLVVADQAAVVVVAGEARRAKVDARRGEAVVEEVVVEERPREAAVVEERPSEAAVVEKARAR